MKRTGRQFVVRIRQHAARLLGMASAEDPTFIVRSDKAYRSLLDPSVLVRNAFLEGKNKLGRDAALCGTATDSVRLGYASTVGAGSTISGEVTVGRYSQIGARVSIHSKYHPMNKVSMYVNSQLLGGLVDRDEKCKPIRVGNDVWVGDGAAILRGVTIGSGAVVGANAVVTKDVPDYAVVAGIPAEIIRMRFDPDVVELLLALRWWDADLRTLEDFPWLFSIDLNEDRDKSIEVLERALRLMGDSRSPRAESRELRTDEVLSAQSSLRPAERSVKGGWDEA